MYSGLFNMIGHESIKKLSENILEVKRDKSKGYFYLHSIKVQHSITESVFFSKNKLDPDYEIDMFIDDNSSCINSEHENAVINRFLDEDVSAIIDSFKIESKSKFIESIETGHVSLEIYECECGYHLSFDTSFLEQVSEEFSIVCPSCDKLTTPDQESDTSEVQDFIQFKNGDCCARWYASCAGISRYYLSVKSSRIIVNIDKNNDALMSDLKQIVTESGLSHFCVTAYKLDLT